MIYHDLRVYNYSFFAKALENVGYGTIRACSRPQVKVVSGGLETFVSAYIVFHNRSKGRQDNSYLDAFFAPFI